MQLREKKVLLTGATGGIGQALLAELQEKGARLVLAVRDPAELQRTLTNGTVVDVVALDLGNEQLWQQAQAIARQHPDIDALVNCAGRNLFAAYADSDPVAVARLLDVNLKGTLLLTQALLPTLLQRPQALIVNIGSTFGSIGYPGFAAYCASKFGLRGFSEALRRELALSAVSVMYVAPRATVTDMNNDAVVAMNQALGNKMDAPARVAASVVSAIQRDQLRLFIGWPEKLFVFMNGLFSGLVDQALRKQLPVIQRFLSRPASIREVKS